MRLIQSIYDVDYPETDGEPMAETELHLNWMIWIREIMRWRFRSQRVYVGCNMFVYYLEDRPDKNLAPDVFVTLDCDPHPRRVFKIWEEERSPNVVFEVTSRSTRQNDEVFKPKIFAQIGVDEYFLYDPEGDYLHPRLQGFRLEDGEYRRLEPDASGAIHCTPLNVSLLLDGNGLVMFDQQTGDRLMTEKEAGEKRIQELEVEVQRLKDELKD